jgi:putative spermidine/putrescine transport system substrate-binding protein
VRKNKFLIGIAIAASSVLAMGVTAPSSFATSKVVNVFISADTNIQDLWVKTLAPAFSAANPGFSVNVIFDLHGVHDSQTTAKVSAATIQHKDAGIDVIDGGFVQQLGSAGLLRLPRLGQMKNLANVSSTTLANGKGGVPYRGSSVLLAYNTKNITNPPKNLDDLLVWIKAHPGKFTYNAPNGGGSGYGFVQTVVDKYMSASDIATLTSDVAPNLETGWKTGLETLRQLNPFTYGQNGTYPANNAATLALLEGGQVDMASVWSDQFTSAVKTGAMPSYIKVTQISGPSFTGGAAYLGIPKASRNQSGATRLVNWILSPKAQNLIMGGTLNGYPAVSLSLLDPTLVATFKDADAGNLRPTYLSANATDLKSAWATAVPGK